MKRNIFTTLLLLISFLSYSQVGLLKNEAATQELSKKITGFFKEGRISESFIELRKYWPLTEEEVSRIEAQTINHLATINQRFGKPIRVIKYKEEKILDIGIQEVYFIQYQYTAIRLEFTYYHNPEGWIVHAFKWNDSFSEEFK